MPELQHAAKEHGCVADQTAGGKKDLSCGK